MRSILLLALSACSLTGLAQNSFTIHGEFEDMPVMPQKVYLFRDTLSGLAPDSATVLEGKYTFTGHFDAPSPAYLSLSSSVKPYMLYLPGKNMMGDQLPFFIDKGPISIVTRGELESTTVTGTAANAASWDANRRIRAAFDAEKTMGALFRETEDQMIYNEVADIIMGLEPVEKADYITYIHSHPNTTIGAWLLNDLISLHQSSGFIDTLQQLYSLLPENIRGSVAGKRVAVHLERELRSAIGHAAPDFTLPDSSGAAINLRSLRGKYVLVHFWQTEGNASNISSTMAYLSKAYKDYKDKGLVVIGVGMDTDKEKWLHSIHELKLNWPQVNDLGGWPGPAPQAFGIHTNNRNVLIDPNGVIIARDLSLTEVDKQLAPIFE